MTYPGICTIMAAVILAVIIIIIHKTTDYEKKTKERHERIKLVKHRCLI